MMSLHVVMVVPLQMRLLGDAAEYESNAWREPLLQVSMHLRDTGPLRTAEVQCIVLRGDRDQRDAPMMVLECF